MKIYQQENLLNHNKYHLICSKSNFWCIVFINTYNNSQITRITFSLKTSPSIIYLNPLLNTSDLKHLDLFPKDILKPYEYT